MSIVFDDACWAWLWLFSGWGDSRSYVSREVDAYNWSLRSAG